MRNFFFCRYAVFKIAHAQIRAFAAFRLSIKDILDEIVILSHSPVPIVDPLVI